MLFEDAYLNDGVGQGQYICKEVLSGIAIPFTLAGVPPGIVAAPPVRRGPSRIAFCG